MIIYSVFNNYDVEIVEVFKENNKILEKTRKNLEN